MLPTWWKNWKLRRQRHRLDKEFERVGLEAKQKKNHDIVKEWYASNHFEFESIDGRIKQNDSDDLLERAEKLYVPTPDRGDKDKWLTEDDLGIPGFRVLTPEAMTALSSAIHVKERERREVWEWWAKFIGTGITALTGLTGAAIGLIAIWKRCR
jgi:hypothetical protein